MNIFLVTFIIVFILVAVMEVIRRLCGRISKSWVKTLVITLIGLVLSTVVAIIAYYSFDFYRNLGSPWTIIIFSLALFFAQKDLDLSVLKPIIQKLSNKVTS